MPRCSPLRPPDSGEKTAAQHAIALRAEEGIAGPSLFQFAGR
jgi:hypothetical protein